MTKIIIQDINVAIEALKKDNLELVNIIGNRIATDSMIIERNDLIILGFLCREVSFELRSIKGRNERNFGKCKEAGIKFLGDLRSLLEAEIENKDIWLKYQDYEEKVRKYLLSDIESSIYQKNPDLTRKTRTMLLDHLNKNKRLLPERGYNLINGVGSEISRVINACGFSPEDLAFYLVMKSFSSFYEYFIHDYQLEEDKDKKKEKNEGIKIYMDNLCEVFSKENDLDALFDESTKIIGELGRRWREYVINLGDIRMIVEEKIELPPEAKKEIEEGIAEVFERKVKEGK